MANGGHRHGVAHLLMELRIRFQRCQSVFGQDVRIVQIDRLVKAPTGGVSVNDLDVFPDRAFSNFFPSHTNSDFSDARRIELRRCRRIDRKDAQTTPNRFGNKVISSEVVR